MLLDEMIKYFQEVEIAVRGLEDAYVERYEEEILTDERANLRIKIRFASGHLLELNEAIILDKGHIRHLSYRYHFQNGQNELIFRYDNTPHFPDLESFPHHKHILEKVVNAKQPSISKVIEETKKIIS